MVYNNNQSCLKFNKGITKSWLTKIQQGYSKNQTCLEKKKKKLKIDT